MSLASGSLECEEIYMYWCQNAIELPSNEDAVHQLPSKLLSAKEAIHNHQSEEAILTTFHHNYCGDISLFEVSGSYMYNNYIKEEGSLHYQY